MASMDTLEELLQEELKDIYDAEKQLTKALPKMAKKASNDELREAIEDHLNQTMQHMERLEQAFEQMGMPARGKKCEGMQHLIAEGDEMIGDAEDEDTRDAVMIAAAQKVEHYEIASYGTIRTWANLLGKSDVAALMVLPMLLLTTLLALGVGIWISALTVRYRDVRFAVPFLLQLGMFISPIIYPSSLLPGRWGRVFALNPMTGIIEGYRSALFGKPFKWTALAASSLITVALLIYSAYAFRRMEKGFADIV